MNELENLYDLILENLIYLNKSQGKTISVQSYLQSLQPYVKQLKASYKAPRVSVDYSNPKTQAAYLFAYYPHYVEMTYKVLKSLQQKDPSLMQLVFDKKYLKVCLFCAGAAPESLGLLSFIQQFYPAVKSIVIYSYDLYSDTWRMSQNITKNIINSCFKDYHFALLSHHLKINQIDSFYSITDPIKDSNIFMFQNCLNEFGENDDIKTMLKNIKFLSENMPSHSLMLINDLKLYAQVTRIKGSIINIINDLNKTNLDDYNEQAFLINKSIEEEESFDSSINVSDNVKKYLLTGEDGLIPRKKTKYKYLSIYKVFTKQSNLFEQSGYNTYINLLEQVNQLQTQFNNFDARLERLLAVESNYLEISEIVESYDQKLEEFQANLQRIANQQEILERERQNFNNLVNNLNIKIQLLESSNDEFRSLNLSSSLETLRYNIQNLELMDSEQERKLEEFQTTLQKQKETIQANIDELMLKISNQQEILEREKQSFNNLVNNLNVKIQLLESSNNEFKSFNLSSSLENIRFNIQDIGRMNSDREIKLNEIERTIYNKLEVFETNLQKQKDRIQTDINKIANQQETFKKDFNNLSNDLSIKIQLIESNNNEFKNLGSNLESLKFNIQNLGHMNSDQEIKLNEIERTLNHFINEERKHLTRQLERNRKAVIFAILSSWLGVILGAIALWQLR